MVNTLTSGVVRDGSLVTRRDQKVFTDVVLVDISDTVETSTCHVFDANKVLA